MNTQSHIIRSRIGSTAALALLLIAIGMIAAMSLTTAVAHRAAQTAKMPPLQRHLARAVERERMNDEGRALYHYRQAMGFTTNQAERAQIALDIAKLLVKEGAWCPARERHIMAADTIIALADADFAQPDQIRLAACALTILPDYRENTFIETAHGLIARLGEPDTLPYRFNARAFEAFFALQDADATCRTLAVLESTATEAQTEQMRLRQYRTRTLWRALRQDAWRLAFAGHHPAFPETVSKTEQQEHLRELLVADVEALRQSGLPAYQFEALAMTALLAVERQDMQTAITTLKEAVFNTEARGREQAAARLLALLKQAGRPEDIDTARSEMLKEASMQPAALHDIRIEMVNHTAPERFRLLFETIADNLDKLDWSHPAVRDLFVNAADIAIERGELDIAEIAIRALSGHTKDPTEPRLRMQQARLAALNGNPEDAAHHLYVLLSGTPPPDLETQARFMLVEMVATPPINITHLVGNAIGNAQKRPQDLRSMKGILMTAQQLEDLKLYDLSLSYYQKLALLGSIHGPQSDDTQTLSAKGMLGQARVLLTMDRDQEADSILRRINSHKQLASVWSESAPLWAAIAMRQGQSREAYRRWKQACGPSNDSLLPLLFEILVPNPQTLLIQPVFVSRPPPSQPPPQLIKAAADAAFKRLIEQGDHVQIDMLLTRMQAATQWHALLPLNRYRVEALNYMQASQPAEAVLEWMQRHAIEIDGAASNQETLLSTEDLRERLVEADSIAMRARARFF